MVAERGFVPLCSLHSLTLRESPFHVRGAVEAPLFDWSSGDNTTTESTSAANNETDGKAAFQRRNSPQSPSWKAPSWTGLRVTDTTRKKGFEWTNSTDKFVDNRSADYAAETSDSFDGRSV